MKCNLIAIVVLACAASSCGSMQVVDGGVSNPRTGGGNGSGGGSALSGGGTAAGGSGGATPCRNTAVFPSQQPVVGYKNGAMNEITSGASVGGTVGAIDQLNIELYWKAGGNPTSLATATFPITKDLSLQGNNASCSTCVKLCEGYTLADACTREYLAQSGFTTIEFAARGTTGGIRAGFSNLRLVEWDFATDKPVTNGKCVTIGMGTIVANF
jgi:hypothetical protein